MNSVLELCCPAVDERARSRVSCPFEVLSAEFTRNGFSSVQFVECMRATCVPRLPPRAAEPASPSTMLLQARKCMRTRQSTATDSRDPPEAQQRRSAGRAVPRLAAARPAERRGEPRCREPAEPRRRGRVDPGRYRIGAGSRRVRVRYRRLRVGLGVPRERGSTGFGLIYLPQTTSNCSLYSYPRTPRLRWQHTPAHVN